MSKASKFLGISEAELTPQEFVDKVTSEHQKLFPKAFSNIKVRKSIGDYTIDLRFGIQDPKDHSNKIERNDRGYHILLIFGLTSETEFGKNIELEASLGGKVACAPEEGSRLAFNMVKVGLRKKKGTPEAVLKHILNYLKKLRSVVDANKDNFGDAKIT